MLALNAERRNVGNYSTTCARAEYVNRNNGMNETAKKNPTSSPFPPVALEVRLQDS